MNETRHNLCAGFLFGRLIVCQGSKCYNPASGIFRNFTQARILGLVSLFITFEGPEGSGKSTQTRLLSDYLSAEGWQVISTREPGGTRIGNAIRQVLLDVAHTEMKPRTETLLFNAARAQLVDEVIRPALVAGKIVLCDRYADSTLAYQGYGHGQDLNDLHHLIEYATSGLKPDLTLYLDIDPDQGLQRKQHAAHLEWNRLDAATLSFHEKVRAAYLRLAEQDQARWSVLNAAQPAEHLHQAIVETVKARLTT